jgi:hypothetical protein
VTPELGLLTVVGELRALVELKNEEIKILQQELDKKDKEIKTLQQELDGIAEVMNKKQNG